jgi:hypothetical protein
MRAAVAAVTITPCGPPIVLIAPLDFVSLSHKKVYSTLRETPTDVITGEIE